MCDFPLVINTNLHPISHRFEVIADYWSNLPFRQRGTPLWHTRSGWTPKLRTMKFSPKKLETLLYRRYSHIYRQSSRFVTIQSLRANIERANIDWTSPFLKGVGHFGPIFQVQGDVPHQPFVHSLGQWMPDNFAAESFHTKKLCSTLSARKAQFLYAKMEKNRFWGPLLGARGNARCSS